MVKDAVLFRDQHAVVHECEGMRDLSSVPRHARGCMDAPTTGYRLGPS
jgi:hypothetical protein